ncbi:MAG: Uma2 family endonuclease [Planctomycetota bacterium]
MLGTSTAPLPATDRIGRLTTDQYFAMIETGIIKEGAPYELLDGLLVLKDRSKKGEPIMSIGDDHTLVVGLLSVVGSKMTGLGCFMQVQCPIKLSSYHSPEPDGAIVRGTLRDYTKRSRSASDVSSVIEVGDSTANSDRLDKGPKYAESGIPQFVLINLDLHAVEIFESPDVLNRQYTSCRIVRIGESVGFLLPSGSRLDVPVSDLLP